jgi:hypothetical protein
MRRTFSKVLGVAVAAAMMLAASAGAATTSVGQVTPLGLTATTLCCNFIQVSDNAGPPGYEVPAPPSGETWTITSWSVRGGTVQGFARVLVWRPTGTHGQFRLVGQGSNTIVDPGTIPSIGVSIPVQPGDVIGLRTDSHHDVPGAFCCTGPSEEIATFAGDPALGQTANSSPGSDFSYGIFTSTRTNVEASLTSAPPAASATGQRDAALKKCKKKHSRKKRKECKKRALLLPA